MKHLVAFFITLCIFSFLAFGISVAVLGVEKDTRTPEAALNSTTTRLNGEYSRIEVSSDFGDLLVYPNDDASTVIIADEIMVDNVTAYIKNDTLYVSCSSFSDSFSFSNLFDFVFSFSGGDVTVYVPEKTYDALYAENASGNTKILNIAAKVASVGSGSGNIVYSQPDDFRSEQLSVDIGSGNGRIYNADTHNYSVEMGSGNIYMYGLTGKGDVDISSGNCRLNYKELDGDISVQIGSGNIDMNFPEGISAEVVADIGSGDVDIDYYDTDTDMDDGDTVKINDGKYKIKIDMGSGNVDITDDIEYELPELPTLPPITDTTIAVEVASIVTTAVTQGVHVGDDGVNVDLGPIGVDVDDEHVDVNVGPIGVDVNSDNVKVEIGDLKVDIG